MGTNPDAGRELGLTEAGALHQQPDLAGHLGAFVGLELGAGAGQHLGQCLGDAVRIGGRENLLDLAGRAEAYRNEFNAVAKDLTSRGVAGQASTISAGIETIGPNFASVAVVMRATQNIPNKPQQATVLGLRVTLTKQDGRWLVMDVTPLASR